MCYISTNHCILYFRPEEDLDTKLDSAVDDVAKSLGGDVDKTKSDLLQKLLSHRNLTNAQKQGEVPRSNKLGWADKPTCIYSTTEYFYSEKMEVEIFIIKFLRFEIGFLDIFCGNKIKYVQFHNIKFKMPESQLLIGLEISFKN